MVVSFTGTAQHMPRRALRARVISERSLLRCLRKVVNKVIQPSLVNLQVSSRAVEPRASDDRTNAMNSGRQQPGRAAP